MNILHITLGLPQNTTGGLPKYAYDLAKNQTINGHNVSLMYPGRFNIIRKRTKIVRRKGLPINIFEIINPVHVPIPYGLSKPGLIIDSKSNNAFNEFFDEYTFDIIHLHTFMGVHEDFFRLAKIKGIKMIYTSHDYFPICPKTTLIDYRGFNCSGPLPEKCAKCNFNVKDPIIMSRIIRGPVYKRIKNMKLIKLIKKFKNAKIDKKKTIETYYFDEKTLDSYRKYINYTNRLFSYLDYIHYNSEVAQDVFKNNNINLPSQIISISLNHITDKRITNYSKVTNSALRLGYIGPKNYQKGFFNLYELAKKLYTSELNIELVLWGDDFSEYDVRNQFVKSMGHFKSNDLASVMHSFDLLIVPSIWKETFGFITLEALSYGIPVIASNNVGSKDVIKTVLPELIYSKLEELDSIVKKVYYNRDLIAKYSDEINKINSQFFDFAHHTDVINDLYKTIGGVK